MLAPSLVARLEDVALTLKRRGPDGGHISLRAYRLTRAMTNALGFLNLAAGSDPAVASFVHDYVDRPRQERGDLASLLEPAPAP